MTTKQQLACDQLAEHLVALAAADNRSHPGAELSDGIRSQLEQDCGDQPWSDARRRCLAAAQTQDDTATCPVR